MKTAFFLFFLLMMFASYNSEAGLPPTSSQGAGDVNPLTTFKFNFDTIPLTHNGTEMVIGIIPITQGGTGSATKNFVDLTTDQTVDGEKDFLDAVMSDDFIFNDPDYSTISVKQSLSHQMGTGVVDGSILTINADPTKFNLSAQTLMFSDYSISSAFPLVQVIDCPALTAQAVTNIAVADSTYISISDSCTVIQSTSFPTATQRRTNAFIGRLVHINHVSIQTAATLPDFSVDTNSQLFDLFDAMGPFNISGNLITANGANLSFNKSAGVTFRRSIGYTTNKLDPNTITQASQTLASFLRFTQTTITGPFTVIDPSIYDLAGTATTIPNPGSNASNKRVFLFGNGQIGVQQGQTYYSGLAEAIAGVSSEVFIPHPTVADGAVLLAIISCRKDATNLSNAAQCHISKAGRFDNSGITVGSFATTTLQQAYNNSVTPQITTSSLLGSLDFRRGSASDADDVISIQNGAGVDSVSFSGHAMYETITNDSAATGSGATLSSPTSPIVRVNNGLLISLAMIPAPPKEGRVLTLFNNTGNSFTILNESGATSANRIYTGTLADITVGNTGSVVLKYDGVSTRWKVIGSAGGGAGGLDISTDNTAAVAVTELRVPNNQLTEMSTGLQRLETGNLNILANPSFEHSVADTGWTASTTDPSVTISVNPIATLTAGAGPQAVELVCDNSAFMVPLGYCIFEQIVNTSSIPQTPFFARAFASIDTGTADMFMRIDGTDYDWGTIQSPTPVNVTTKQNLYLSSTAYTSGSSTTGVRIQIEVGFGEVKTVRLDDMFLGADIPTVGGVDLFSNQFIDGQKYFYKLRTAFSGTASHPCPSVTNTQMASIGALDGGDCVWNTDQLGYWRGDSSTGSWRPASSGPISVPIPALAIDWSKGNVFYKDVAANSTFTFTNVNDGQTIIAIIKNTSGGTITLTLPAGLIKPAAFPLTIAAGKESLFTFVRYNSKTAASVVQDIQ